MAKNKTLKVLSTASVAGMIAAAVLSSQAFAAVNAYSVKIGDDVFKYDKAALTESFLAAKAGEAAPLYDDFTTKFTQAKGFYAFSDDKTGKFVSYDDIQAKFLEAKTAGTTFVVDTYTASADAKVLEVPTVKKVVVKDGKVAVETEGQVASALKVDSVSAINTNAQAVVLDGATNVQSNASFTIALGAEVDPATVTSANVKLYSVSSTGTLTQVGLTGIAVATTDTTNKTIVARPATYLTKGQAYRLVVTTGLKSKDGGALAANKEINFTVDQTAVIATGGMDATANANFVKNQSLAAGSIGAGNVITLTFDRDIDLNTLNTSNVKVKDLSAVGTPYIAYTLGTATAGAPMVSEQVTLTWTTALTVGHKYQIEVNNLKTTAGYNVANDVIPFIANDTAMSIANVFDKDGNNLNANKLYPKMAGGIVVTAVPTPEGAAYRQGAGLVVTLGGIADTTTMTSSNVYITEKGSTEKIPATVEYNLYLAAGQLRVTPTVDLKEKTTYVLHLSTGVKTAAGSVLAAEATSEFATYDLTAPTILGVDGADTVQAGVENTITVHFSEAIAIYDKFNNNAIVNISKGSGATGAILGISNALSLTDITAAGAEGGAAAQLSSVTTSQDGKDLILKVIPTSNNNVYRIRLNGKDTPSTNAYFTDKYNTATAAASINNALTADYDIVFTTVADKVAPGITSVKSTYENGAAASGGNVATIAADAVATNIDLDNTGATHTNFAINFNSTDVDPATLTTTTVTLYDVTAATAVTLNAGSPSFTNNDAVNNSGNDRTVVIPGAALTSGHTYTLTLNGVKDLSGNIMDKKVYTFVAGNGPVVAATAPVINAVLADNNNNAQIGETSDVDTSALNEDIFVDLGTGVASIDPATLANTITLTKVGGDAVTITTTTATGNIAATPLNNHVYLRIHPSVALDAKSTYTVTLGKGIKDVNGNALFVNTSGRGPEDYTFKFSTPDETKPVVSSVKYNGTALSANAIVPTNPIFTVEFSKAVKKGSADALLADKADYAIYTKAEWDAAAAIGGVATNTVVAGVTTAKLTGSTNVYSQYTLTPAGLAANTDYVLVIVGDNTVGGSGIEDASAGAGAAGNAMAANYVLPFTTGAAAVDITKPTLVASSSFLSGANQAAVVAKVDGVLASETVLGNKTYQAQTAGDKSFGFKFSEAVDLTNATVTVTDLSATNTPAVGVANWNAVADLTAGGTTVPGVVVNLAATPTANNYLKFVFHGVKDASGNVADDITVYVIAQ